MGIRGGFLNIRGEDMKINKKMFRKKNIFQRMFDFSGILSVSQFWTEVFMLLISFLCAVVTMLIVISSTIKASEQELILLGNILVWVLVGIWCLSLIKLMVRRLRDGGHSAKKLLWLLLPVAGPVILLVLLFSRSLEYHDIDD
jgi:uncharacterized membrane protein YhaH (DUF805 family)